MGASVSSSCRHSRSVRAARLFSARYSRRRAFLDFFAVVGTAKFSGGSEMLDDALGKIMRTRSVRTQHEIEVIGFGRMDRGHERVPAGIGDRSRRQAGVAVGVV